MTGGAEGVYRVIGAGQGTCGQVLPLGDLILRHGGWWGAGGLGSAGLWQTYLQQEGGFPARPSVGTWLNDVTNHRGTAEVGVGWGEADVDSRPEFSSEGFEKNVLGLLLKSVNHDNNSINNINNNNNTNN